VIRLRVPGSLTYRHLALRVVSAACKMAAPPGGVRGDLGLDDTEDEGKAGSDLFAGADERASFAGAAGIWDDAGAGSGADDLSDEEFEAQTLSAFGEAFNNIAIHGYRSGPPGNVDIEIESDEEGIVIRLIDTGSSFDPNCVAVPDMADLPESGMGLFIINSFMDEVDYSPGKPNVLRLAKRREGRTRLGDGDDGDTRGAAQAAGAA